MARFRETVNVTAADLRKVGGNRGYSAADSVLLRVAAESVAAFQSACRVQMKTIADRGATRLGYLSSHFQTARIRSQKLRRGRRIHHNQTVIEWCEVPATGLNPERTLPSSRPSSEQR